MTVKILTIIRGARLLVDARRRFVLRLVANDITKTNDQENIILLVASRRFLLE